MQTTNYPRDRFVHLWFTDALSSKPQCQTYPYKWDARRNQWVSSIGVPYWEGPFKPKLHGWSEVPA